MENTGYTILTRQSGLTREMSVIANNIANASTTGFRQEGLVFSEFVKRVEGGNSVSMSTANVSTVSNQQGALTLTNGTYDLAIEGDGYFMIETEDGERFTRAGALASNADGDLVTMDGYRVLDAGGSAIFVPPDASDIHVSGDGTIGAGGQILAQIGLFKPADPNDLVRETGASFRIKGDVEPVEDGKILQGFLENSNVETISQLSRMIQVQRAYETGQSFLEAENERVLNAVKTLVR